MNILKNREYGLPESVLQYVESWTMTRFLGYEDKMVTLLEALYEDTMSAVRVDGGLSEWFANVVGVTQGCSYHYYYTRFCLR